MAPITAEQHQHLLSIVLDCLAGRNIEVVADGWAVADRDRGGVYGLINLSQELRGIPETEWPELVRRRVSMLDGITPDLPETFELAAPKLRIRLTADGSEPGWAAFRNVCDGLDQQLMLRNEVGCVTVTGETLKKWGVGADLAFAAALERTVWDEPRERRVLAKGDLRLSWVRASFFASSLLLDLRHLLTAKNRYGALAMVPCRDALLFAEIEDDRIVRAAASMIEVGGQWYSDGPGSISPDVFWFRRDGSITRVVKAADGGYDPCWGRDFSAVLADLEPHRSPRSPSTKKGRRSGTRQRS